jgi:hypothetical protein
MSLPSPPFDSKAGPSHSPVDFDQDQHLLHPGDDSNIAHTATAMVPDEAPLPPPPGSLSASSETPNTRYEYISLPETLPSWEIRGNSSYEERRNTAVAAARKRWPHTSPLPSIPILTPAQMRPYRDLLSRVDEALRILVQTNDVPRLSGGDHSVPTLVDPELFSALRDSFVHLLSLIPEEAQEDLLKKTPVPSFAVNVNHRSLLPIRDFVLAAALYREEVESFLHHHYLAYHTKSSIESALRRQRRRTSGLTASPNLSAVPEYLPLTNPLRQQPPHLGRLLVPPGMGTEHQLPYRPPPGLPQSRRMSELFNKPTFRRDYSPQNSYAPVRASTSIVDSPIAPDYSVPSSFPPPMPSSPNMAGELPIFPTSMTGADYSNVNSRQERFNSRSLPSAQPRVLPAEIQYGKLSTANPRQINEAPIRNRRLSIPGVAPVEQEPLDQNSLHSHQTLHYSGSIVPAGWAGSRAGWAGSRAGSAGSLTSHSPTGHSRHVSSLGGQPPRIPPGGAAPNPGDPDGSSSSDDGDGDDRRGYRGEPRGHAWRNPRELAPQRNPARVPGAYGFGYDDPPAPARANPPQFDHKLKPDIVPEWDGHADTLMRWIQTINQISERSLVVYQQLGDIVPLRLKDQAANWFYDLDYARRIEVTNDWGTLRQAIRDHFMNRSWMDRQKKRAFTARYRDSSAPSETPSDYFHRKLTLLTSFADWTDSQLISEIMESAPDFWVQIIDVQRMGRLEDLQNAIRYHEERLTNGLRSQDRDNRKLERLQEQVSALMQRVNRSERSNYRPSGSVRANYLKSTNIKTKKPEGIRSKQALGTQVTSKPRFPKDDRNVTKRGLPPSMKGGRPCRHCGSLMHWDNECVHARKVSTRANAANATDDFDLVYDDPEPEDATDYEDNPYAEEFDVQDEDDNDTTEDDDESKEPNDEKDFPSSRV